MLASADALTEFDGQRLLDADEAATPAGRVPRRSSSATAPEELTYANLNRAFRLVRDGAELIGMHRNPWWLTPDGPTLDSGAYVTGLEFATGRRRRIIGKPAPAFFSIAVAGLCRRDLGERAPAVEIAMVGDDIRTDVAGRPARGLRGVFVLTGKTRARTSSGAAAPGRRRPRARRRRAVAGRRRRRARLTAHHPTNRPATRATPP